MEPGTLALLIPIVAILGGIVSGIVSSLTKHQRQMAEIMRGTSQNNNSQVLSELQALRSEVSVLRDRVNAVAIASDQSTAIQPPNLPDDVAQRLQS